ncbi:MAG: hypothetical protein AAFN63_03935 [Pseudomonadota bacterium]
MSTIAIILIFGPVVAMFLATIGLTIYVRRGGFRAHFGKDINQAAHESWVANRDDCSRATDQINQGRD